MKSGYLENWEVFAGGLMLLAFVASAVILGRELSHWWLVISAVLLTAGGVLMWRVKAAQRAADRLLNRQLESDSIKCN